MEYDNIYKNSKGDEGVEENRKNYIGTDFTSGRVMPMLLKFFLPFLLANVLNSLYNTVDTIIIGQFVGSTGIVAVNLGGKMLTLFTQVGLGLAGGGQVLISQLVGAKKRDELNSTIGTLFTEMLVISTACAVVTFIFAKDILKILNTPAESYDAAYAYLCITIIGLPLIFGYNAVSSVLRGMGDSKSPLIFIAIATVVNIIGDVVFILVFDLGAAGTAIATVLGQGVSLVFSLSTLYRRREKFGFDFKLSSFAIDWRKLRLMLKLGFPVAVRGVFIISTQLYMLSFVNGYGLVPAAAYSIGDKIYQLANIFTMAARQAAGAMAAQNIGAGRPDRAKTIAKCSAVISYSAAFTLSCLALAFPRSIFALFTDDPGVMEYAVTFLRIACLIFFFSATICPFEAIVSGTGQVAVSFIGGILDGVVFRIGFSFLFAFVLDMGVAGFFLGDAMARWGIILTSGSYVLFGKWENRKKLVDQIE